MLALGPCAAYSLPMRNLKKLFLFILAPLLCACGPKEIGEGQSYEPPTHAGLSQAEQMRFPLTGSNKTEQLLYYYNRPDVMQRVQKWRRDEFNRRLGLEPSPEDPAYREHPRERSPFRQ